jgi:hypothetical protein
LHGSGSVGISWRGSPGLRDRVKRRRGERLDAALPAVAVDDVPSGCAHGATRSAPGGLCDAAILLASAFPFLMPRLPRQNRRQGPRTPARRGRERPPSSDVHLARLWTFPLQVGPGGRLGNAADEFSAKLKNGGRINTNYQTIEFCCLHSSMAHVRARAWCAEIGLGLSDMIRSNLIRACSGS